MKNSEIYVQNPGSNQDASKVLIIVVLGSVMIGGFWSLLGPGLGLVGTWQYSSGGSFEIVRFDADGSYWSFGDSGFISMALEGTYEVVGTSGKTYKVRLKTNAGVGEGEYRLESPDKLAELDSDNPENSTLYTRVGDWVMTRRPSSNPSTYGGAKPHLGCWQLDGMDSPTLEINEDGSLVLYLGERTEKATYSVDYSQIPFHFDATDDKGVVDAEIFDFRADGSLRISQTNGDRPEKMGRYQTYFPCSQPEL